MNGSAHYSKIFLVVLFASAFALNWIWEMAQMYFYRGMSQVSFLETTFYCTLATFGDAVLTIAGYMVGKLLTRSHLFLWMALFGAVSAVLIEFAALALGIWSYKSSMPAVPFLNIGMLPFLQLTILMPAALKIADLWEKRKNR